MQVGCMYCQSLKTITIKKINQIKVTQTFRAMDLLRLKKSTNLFHLCLFQYISTLAFRSLPKIHYGTLEVYFLYIIKFFKLYFKNCLLLITAVKLWLLHWKIGSSTVQISLILLQVIFHMKIAFVDMNKLNWWVVSCMLFLKSNCFWSSCI